jgi:hypothetical protein
LIGCLAGQAWATALKLTAHKAAADRANAVLEIHVVII